MALEAGMVLSNEPGYYQTGDWGIRIENLIVVTPVKQTGFLEFETITLCPLDRRLIDKTRLDAGEIDWIDQLSSRGLRTITPTSIANGQIMVRGRLPPAIDLPDIGRAIVARCYWLPSSAE